MSCRNHWYVNLSFSDISSTDLSDHLYKLITLPDKCWLWEFLTACKSWSSVQVITRWLHYLIDDDMAACKSWSLVNTAYKCISCRNPWYANLDFSDIVYTVIYQSFIHPLLYTVAISYSFPVQTLSFWA